jgi:hypothetical protein
MQGLDYEADVLDTPLPDLQLFGLTERDVTILDINGWQYLRDLEGMTPEQFLAGRQVGLDVLRSVRRALGRFLKWHEEHSETKENR